MQEELRRSEKQRDGEGSAGKGGGMVEGVGEGRGGVIHSDTK